ncbi:MAG: maleylacetoacetate isomerase [Paralcaligenes sp.]
MQLYSFFNSSTSYRVRIALALKQVKFDYLPVNIRAQEHKTADYLAKNPGAGVPLLVDESFDLGQSLAIIDYLDSKYPKPLLIPENRQRRARVLEIANLIACDMHPVNNLKVLRYLVNVLKISEEQKNAWYQHWIDEGLRSLEALLQRAGSGPYCVGDAPTLADCCLVPQVANALRMKCKVDEFTRVMAVYRHCNTVAAFQQAAPEQQPDFGT